MGENELSGSLPATISGMTSLEKLVLWENELTAIDPETERPPALSECSLQVGTAACKRPLSPGCIFTLLVSAWCFGLQDCEWACPLPEWATDECHAKCDAHTPGTRSTRDVAK